jgi:XTP/dITP diphosphohydrolase
VSEAPGTDTDSARGRTGPRVALVETSDVLPGLLPFQSWDVLGTADRVRLRDPDGHPAAPQLYLAGLDLERVEPAALERADMDLNRPGSPDDRRIAKSLVGLALAERDVVYLLGPDESGLAPALAGMAAEHDLEIELVFLAQQPEGAELLRLVEVMRALRDPVDGCPWDLEQDHTTLARYAIEETYELVDAIERGHDVDLEEELGDVLLQVVFHARIAADRRAFGIDEVARGIADKLVRRHPHVFADGEAADAQAVQANWDTIKQQEKGRSGPFDGVPPAGPGLDLLATLQRKAARRGVPMPSVADARTLLAEALDVADAADDPADREAAVGSALEGLVAYARTLDVDPERAARAASRRFRGRTESALQTLEADGVDPATLDSSGWRQRLSDVSTPQDPGASGDEG